MEGRYKWLRLLFYFVYNRKMPTAMFISSSDSEGNVGSYPTLHCKQFKWFLNKTPVKKAS